MKRPLAAKVASRRGGAASEWGELGVEGTGGRVKKQQKQTSRTQQEGKRRRKRSCDDGHEPLRARPGTLARRGEETGSPIRCWTDVSCR